MIQVLTHMSMIKLFVAMIMVLIPAVWYASKKYYEKMEEPKNQYTIKVIAATTITLLTGQIIWTKAKYYKRSWKAWLQQQPKPKSKLGPKDRAASTGLFY